MEQTDEMTLVAEYDGYSEYEDRDGDTVYISDAGIRLVDFDDLDLNDEWRSFKTSTPWPHTKAAFEAALRLRVTEPDRVDELTWCDDCQDIEDDLSSVNGGNDMVCQSCLDNYSFCEDCEEYVHGDYVDYTLHDRSVCESCRDHHYGYCEHCDGYYHYDWSDEHQHGGCDCEAPAQTFRVRNDGEAPLANDTRATIALPAGEISDEGMGEISRLIRSHPNTIGLNLSDEDDYAAYRKWTTLSYQIVDLGTTWQTKEGNFTKRLSRFAYKEHGLKVPPAVLSEVGNVAHAHSQGVDFAIETTRNLNLPAEDFYHEDSCWWQSYSESRCALKNNGGFGLRTFATQKSYYGVEYEAVMGRAWVMPLRLDGDLLTPTFETESPDAFIVFNGYGDLSGYAPARIMAHMAGMTYRKVGFDASPMYVNNSTAYLVAPEEIASEYTDGEVRFYLSTHANLHATEQRAAALAQQRELATAGV